MLSKRGGAGRGIYRYAVSLRPWAITLLCPGTFFSDHMPSFDLHCRYALLTYAQCGDLSPDLVGNKLVNAGFQCVIGRENHQDGGIHLHVFVDFGRKRRFRRPDVFDVEGRHPNIEPSKGTPEKGYDYAIKDGDIVFDGLERPGRNGDSGNVAKWAAITGAVDKQSFWDLVHELDPKSAACNFPALQKYCDWKYAVDPPEYESPAGVTFVGGEFDGRDDWLSQSGIGVGEPLIGMCFIFSAAGPCLLLGWWCWVPTASLRPPFGGSPARCQIY